MEKYRKVEFQPASKPQTYSSKTFEVIKSSSGFNKNKVDGKPLNNVR